jgi:hypothetical protein
MVVPVSPDSVTVQNNIDTIIMRSLIPIILKASAFVLMQDNFCTTLELPKM